MNIKELKELIANVPDDAEVFISGDHHGTSNAVGYHDGYVIGEDQYDMYAVDEKQLTDDEDQSWEDDFYLRSDAVRGFVIYGVA